MRVAILTVALIGCGRLGFDPIGGDPGPDGGANGDGNPNALVDDGGSPTGQTCVGLTCSVPGGAYLRDNNTLYPAELSPFVLDHYEVTVSRFRAFVDAGFGTRVRPPFAGDGADPRIASSGWQDSWTLLLPDSTNDLADRVASVNGATFTASIGSNERMPIVGVSWYEAFAFCIWDGGRLPTFAEHEFAAYGGDEQRPYPWGSTWDPTRVTMGALDLVGSRSPLGDARWGHADLVGNADEWALDYFGSLPQPCRDCANLAPESTPTRVQLGGSFYDSASRFSQADLLHGAGPAQRHGGTGFRCARDP